MSPEGSRAETEMMGRRERGGCFKPVMMSWA